MSEVREYSHLVTKSVKPRQKAEAWCGEVVVARGEKWASDKPVCKDCTMAVLNQLFDAEKAYNDLSERLFDISTALTNSDVFGNILRVDEDSVDLILNAFWRPGAGRVEGPTREDGSF